MCWGNLPRRPAFSLLRASTPRWQAAAAKSAQQRAHDVLRASAALQLAQAVRGGVDIKEARAFPSGLQEGCAPSGRGGTPYHLQV